TGTELEKALTADTRKILITTIFKFGELKPGVQNPRDNIIVLVDEAHRTQEGDLGRKMRDTLPKAFFFGLTGTPINKADRHTFWTFGAEEAAGGYMDRYPLQDAIRDGATLPLHFDPRLVQLRVDRGALDEAFRQLTGHLTESDQNELGKRAARLGVLLKAPARVAAVCADIARHFRESVEPAGFKAQVVTFDREACLLYKRELDKHLPPEASTVVMTVGGDEQEYAEFRRDADEERVLLDRYRDPADPLKIL